MKYIVKEYHKDTPDRLLIADMRKTAKSLGKDYISMKEYASSGVYHASTIYARFGGWNAAIEKAKMTVQYNRNVTDDMLMLNLKNVWDSLGRQPKLKEMAKPLSAYGKAMYANRFGRWIDALNAFVAYMNRRKTKCAGFIPGKKLLNNSIRRRRVDKKKRPEKLKCSKIISPGLRYIIFKRDKFKCRLCGASPATDPKVKLHVDHIIPRARGGKTASQNLQTLCSKCNLGKANS